MKGMLVAVVLLLAPVLAGAEELDGSFHLSWSQPRCVRAPCPPARWTIRQEVLFRTVPRVVVDPATPAPIQAAIARAGGLNPSTVEGAVRIENGVATLLLRRFTPIRRR